MNFVYPEIPPEAIYTAQGGHDTIHQNVLINVPFQFVKISSKGLANGPKLTIDRDPQVDSFTFGKLKEHSRRDSCRHPSDSKTILMFVCKSDNFCICSCSHCMHIGPPVGTYLTGPIDTSGEIHECFEGENPRLISALALSLTGNGVHKTSSNSCP